MKEDAMIRSLQLLCLRALLCLLPSWLANPGNAAAAAKDPSAHRAQREAPLAELFGSMRFRNIGPFRGGRVCAVTGVRGQPMTFYFGSAGGGVWKTTDGGTFWEPVSDRYFKTGSVGAIAVAPTDPNIVYVGTGESQIRGNVAAGDGIYRSMDAGRTWSNVGLRDTQHIARVIVHPQDPETVYVAAFGHAWGANRERGIYRTRDGGKNWTRALFVDERTGASDLAMDPRNPRILYAAFWQARRSPWSMESGGPGSGLYRSTDGGDCWKKVGGGLPAGPLGRIGVAVSGAREGRVWALVEARDGGLFRSDDRGETWSRVSSAHKLRQRAWYYSWVYADPRNADTVYVPNTELNKSIDGGRTFTVVVPRFSDNHDLWIDPDDSNRMILGNDAGAKITFNGGSTWSSQDNQPTAQIYRVATDDRTPYWVYGAQQDSTTIAIPSAVPGKGIGESDWHEVGGGESGWVAPDPRDPEVVYAGGYGGSITRHDHRTRQAREITAFPQPIDGLATRDLVYRFNWNAPIVVSRHDSRILYHAAQKLLRSDDAGETWKAASHDLTRNDKSKQGYSGGKIGYEIAGVEVYDTIFALAESPHEPGTIWVGTDDGRVQLTRGGGIWKDVTPRGLPDWIQINSLEVSPHDRATAYIAATLYKFDDRRPFLYSTHDYGETWRKIVDGLPAAAFTRVVREDPVRGGLLYAGTEAGIYVSLDRGASWQPFQLNLPAVPITDLQVKGTDLVVATQGRGFWILDDLTPLRQWDAAGIAGHGVHLFPPRPAWRSDAEKADAEQTRHLRLGENPPLGMVINFWLAAEPAKTDVVSLDILGGPGSRARVIRSYSNQHPGKKPGAEQSGEDGEDDDAGEAPLTPRAGLNRFTWDLRMAEPKLTVPKYVYDDYPPEGVKVSPGIYKVRLRSGSQTLEVDAQVGRNPLVSTSAADLERQAEVLDTIHSRLESIHELARRISDVKAQLQQLAERLARLGEAGDLPGRAGKLIAQLDGVAEQLVNPELQADEDSVVYTPKLDFQFAALAAMAATADARPTAAEERRFAELDAQLTGLRSALQALLDHDLGAFNRAVKESGVQPVILVPAAGGSQPPAPPQR
jgi:photosystem II stability/assembly factor-like uncharacterized protein